MHENGYDQVIDQRALGNLVRHLHAMFGFIWSRALPLVLKRAKGRVERAGG